MQTRLEQVEREDLMTFISTSMVATAQNEYYSAGDDQEERLSFLHTYVMGNYRRLYARCLAAGLTHDARARIVANLLAAGAPEDPAARREEGQLIAAGVKALPPQRVYRLIARLRRQNVNNRRTRATFDRWLQGRRLEFDAVKYRRHLRGAARYLHARLPDEVGRFLTDGPDAEKQWTSPLLDAFRRARYDTSAIYELPLTVAEGLAERRGIEQQRFLERILPQLTQRERVRAEQRLRRAKVSVAEVDLGDMALTDLCLYLLSRPIEERRDENERIVSGLARAARRAAGRTAARFGRVACVLDNSRSSAGSRQKRNRPLGVAWAVGALMRELAESYTVHWTGPMAEETLVRSVGPTGLAAPLLDALATAPDLVLVVSDGFENAPPGAAAEVVRVYRERLDPEGRTHFVHINPAYDDSDYHPTPLGEAITTLGIRRAEELPMALGFVPFLDGRGSLAELQEHLGRLAAQEVSP